MYKIFHNIVDLDFDEYFTNNSINQTYNLRRHNNQIKLEKYSGSTVRNNFFCDRIKPLWNQLPHDLAESPSLSIFKLKLDKFDISKIYTSKL